ncbi:hypothetical protein G6O69_04435 [Pseudenhygromyxa sp. WMMC2535]|uniref:hypothetical protein n=1 Tax=Pseudenhygromyxa sp. WMMC2535 TaxID=2712867 RepID=UPI00155222EB|nr:hypothetical protein [Pseudenhygromyxa sp. WMMC2535]NVB37066.1 hypothetical protein [Pseudenhygromyxa sp. WMMC2535]
MQSSRAMTASNIRQILTHTINQLHDHELRYGQISVEVERVDPGLSSLTNFLASRERRTIDALTCYLEREDEKGVLDVHVRLGGGFPFECATGTRLEAMLEAILATAEAVDLQLEQLSPRIGLYVPDLSTTEVLRALETLAQDRRKQLCAALREFDEMGPRPTAARSPSSNDTPRDDSAPRSAPHPSSALRTGSHGALAREGEPERIFDPRATFPWLVLAPM